MRGIKGLTTAGAAFTKKASTHPPAVRGWCSGTRRGQHSSCSKGPEMHGFSVDVKLPTAATVKAESPAAERNKVPILEVLQSYLSPQSTKGTLLELASGSGQHASFFASQYPHLTYQPSDYTGELFGSISAWCEGVPNVRPPILIDASQPGQWQAVLSQAGAPEHLDAMLCVNMTHISPWEATQGLLQGAAKHLKPQGYLFIYGPFKRAGQHTTDSNAAFDASLRARNPAWGYRDVESEVQKVGEAAGLALQAVKEMPANNFMLVFQKA